MKTSPVATLVAVLLMATTLLPGPIGHARKSYLYFKVSTTTSLISMPLARSRPLQAEPLEAGGEIDLVATEDLWKQIASVFQRYGDANQASVTLAVENIIFSDGFQWNRGHLLRRDPANLNQWKPVNAKCAIFLANDFFQLYGEPS